jgi:hypothetical protein
MPWWTVLVQHAAKFDAPLLVASSLLLGYGTVGLAPLQAFAARMEGPTPSRQCCPACC